MLTLTCAEARELIFDYLDGELDTSTARAVERHRDRCQNCPPLVSAIMAMLGRLRSLPEPAPDEGFLSRLGAIALNPPDPQ
ncbi:MAG: anti-sigma factor family protein [Acidimicrobiales bacterium]